MRFGEGGPCTEGGEGVWRDAVWEMERKLVHMADSTTSPAVEDANGGRNVRGSEQVRAKKFVGGVLRGVEVSG